MSVVDDEWAASSHTGVIVREDDPQTRLDFRLDRGLLIHGTVTHGLHRRPVDGKTITLVQTGDDVPEVISGRIHRDSVAHHPLTKAV